MKLSDEYNSHITRIMQADLNYNEHGLADHHVFLTILFTMHKRSIP